MVVGDGIAIVEPEAGRVVYLAYGEGQAGALGSAVILASSRGISDVAVLYDDPGAAAAATRRATALRPAPTVRLVQGRDLTQLEPAPLPETQPPIEPPDGFIDLCGWATVDPILEDGIWRGEILGLEVVRAGDTGIEIGVGRLDREAGLILHADRPPVENLRSVAETVRGVRRRGAGAHPLATLVRERWLRHDLISDPSSLGLTGLAAVDPAEPPSGLRDGVPAAAVGIDPGGDSVLVVCSVGVDPDLVPSAADLVLRERPDRLIVVLPIRDVLPTVVAAVERIALTSTVLGVTGGWS